MEASPPVGTPAVADGRLFALTSGVQAYESATGRVLWQSPVRKYLPRKLLAAQNKVFVVESVVSALDAETGRPLWEFAPGANASLGRAALDDRTLYFGTADHHMYALRISDGRKLWSLDLGGGWKYPAAVRGVAVSDGKVYATVEQWRDPSGTTASGWLIALDARNGKVLWRFVTGEGEARQGLSSSPAVTANLLLAADYLSNSVVAVDRRTGKLAWRFQGQRGYVGFPEAPIVSGGRVFAGSGDTFVYCLDLLTGLMLWKTHMPGANESYALCGDKLLVSHQEVAALDPQTGSIVQVTLSGQSDFPTSDFAMDQHTAFILGPKAVYALACK